MTRELPALEVDELATKAWRYNVNYTRVRDEMQRKTVVIVHIEESECWSIETAAEFKTDGHFEKMMSLLQILFENKDQNLEKRV